ncbi:hypothetical protein BDW02DRAFT_353712 [Decorospora gaudefroyi]|uniref:Uncharacterized protein n=1 Tax=Decorospora gaudefroyi TaxID=184978 RepID=A0A6A5K8D9_9PLEO|nr:hypothetical protein BDW02DRAFT_353712 [Decorospora gaudefroyi]
MLRVRAPRDGCHSREDMFGDRSSLQPLLRWDSYFRTVVTDIIFFSLILLQNSTETRYVTLLRVKCAARAQQP